MTPDYLLSLALASIAAAIALGLLAYIFNIARRRKHEEPGEVEDQAPKEDSVMDDKDSIEEMPDVKETSHAPDDGVATVARLLRDKKSGKLLVSIDERRYSKSTEIDDPEVRSLLDDASADLSKWLSMPVSAKSPTGKAPPADVETPPDRPLNMIEEINEILENRGAKGDASKRLRLYEGPEGSVRVYVGVNSYEVDQIPDKKMRRVINEAVAEWEARQ